MKYVISIVIGYMLGCLNNAYFISKAKGFDIREKGTHNAGASNMKLQLGWGYGVLTALLDIAKGIVAVLLAKYLYPDTNICWFAAGAMAVMGHIFPFHMNFKGGKGYATYVGFMLAIDWRVGLACIIYGVIGTLVINYIAIPTITTVIAVPFWFLYCGESLTNVLILCAVGAIIVWKHRVNIQRMMRHEEIGLREKKKDK